MVKYLYDIIILFATIEVWKALSQAYQFIYILNYLSYYSKQILLININIILI